MQTSAIYAGTFDPITLGHLDLIQRAAHIFSRLVVAVAETPRKQTLFTAAERGEMVREATQGIPNVDVRLFGGLLVEFAHASGIHVLIRGIRAFSDFEYEFQMALTNRRLAPDVETMFLMPKETHSYVNSSTVREIASLGGDLRDFVPASAIPHIERYLRQRR